MQVFEVAGSRAGNMGRVCVRLGTAGLDAHTKIVYDGATGPRHHPASSRMLFLCGYRAVPKAKLSLQKSKKKKTNKTNQVFSPSKSRLAFSAVGNRVVSAFSDSVDTHCAPLLANQVPGKVSLFSLYRSKNHPKGGSDLMWRCVLMRSEA